MKKIIIIVFAVFALSSCKIYKPYSRPEVQTDSLYRDVPSDTLNLGDYSWQSVFTDPNLQKLIEQALERNVDLKSAELRIEQSQAMLRTAKLSFAPSISIAPQGALSSFALTKTAKTYQLPVNVSWELDVFGKLHNTKKGAASDLLSASAYAQVVHSGLIANVANSYYTLLMLDRQLEISQNTVLLWEENIRTMQAMKQAGMTNEAAISQSIANSQQVKTGCLDLQRQIREVENALSLLLMQTPQPIERGLLAQQMLPETLNVGVPMQVLSNRPDVVAAEMQLASAYYTVNVARSAFYPQISIGGTGSWVNSAGDAIFNPGKLILSAVGQLTQPIFNRGKLVANLKVTKAEEQIAQLNFEQSVLNAGREVSDYLYQYQTAVNKAQERAIQLEALNKAVDYTKILFTTGSASYLEVIVARQSLLSAELSDVADTFEKMQSVVNLYKALGGGKN